ncbi:MAG: MATE family efflux transporter [Lentilitoribacter sp.]
MNYIHHIKRTWLLSLPLVGSQLAQIAINTTDTVMLGWHGTFSLASGVLGTQAVFFFFIFGAGFGHAVVPLASSAFAKDDTRSLRRAIRMGLWITGLIGLVSMPIMWNVEKIFVSLGQDEDVSSLAAEYVRVAQWSLFPALWALVFRNFFATLEKAQIVFWAIIPGILLNGLLNYAFIFGNWGAPELGVVGAAWASLGTNIIIMAVLVGWLYIHKHYRQYELLTRVWRSDWSVFWRVATLGLPISISILAEISMFSGASLLMGLIGPMELAAHGIALQLAAIAFMIPLGISGAATIRVSNAYGREDMSDIMLASKAALVVAMLFAVATALIIAVFSAPLISLFLDSANADAATVAMIALPLVLVAAAFQLVDSGQVIAAGVLRGFQDATMPMIINLISYGLGLALAYVLCFQFGLGPVGIWYGLTAGLAFSFICLGIRYFYMISKIKQELA